MKDKGCKGGFADRQIDRRTKICENKMNYYLGKVYNLTIYRSSSKLVKSSEYILYSLPGQITMIQ